MDTKDMLIDIGADDRADAEKIGIRPGQSVVPICPFTPMANEKKILAKAWDNRYGCGLSVELLKELQGETVPNKLYSGATVQEEVGLRGAKVAANMIQPDIFYALDASPANDMSGDDKEFGQLGQGALLRIFDRTMITHRGMREFILDTAESNDIPYQYLFHKAVRMQEVFILRMMAFHQQLLAYAPAIFTRHHRLSMWMIIRRRKNYW